MDPICRNHIETFRVTWLNQQMHVADNFPKIRPCGPGSIFQGDVRKPIDHHFARSQDSRCFWTIIPFCVHPNFCLRFQFPADLNACCNGAKEVFLCSRCAERANAKDATRLWPQWTAWIGRAVNIIKIRQISTGGSISVINESAELLAVSSNTEIVNANFKVQVFPDQFNAARIRLQEPNVRMAIHRELNHWKLCAEKLKHLRSNPRSRNDNVGDGRIAWIGSLQVQKLPQHHFIGKRKNFSTNATSLQKFCGIYCGNAKSRMTDSNAASGEVLITKNDP